MYTEVRKGYNRPPHGPENRAPSQAEARGGPHSTGHFNCELKSAFPSFGRMMSPARADTISAGFELLRLDC